MTVRPFTAYGVFSLSVAAAMTPAVAARTAAELGVEVAAGAGGVVGVAVSVDDRQA